MQNFDSISALLGLMILVMIGFVYFLPYIVARGRKHMNAEAIGVLNFFLGWTLIGWVCALVWANTSNVRRT